MNQNETPRESGASQDEQGENPYFAHARGNHGPDLDAGAPELRVVEDRRLDRKALAFMAAILVVLAVLGYLLYKSAMGSGEQKEVVRETPTVATPRLPAGAEPVPAGPRPDEIQVIGPPPLPPKAAETVTYVEPPRSSPEISERRGPSLMERRMASAGDGSGSQVDGMNKAEYTDSVLSQLQPGSGGAGFGQEQEDTGQAAVKLKDVSSARFLRNADVLLVRGTYLRCVLETRIISDVDGFTSCNLTEPVYSINGRTLLLPKGSKIYGSYRRGLEGQRQAVVWDRVTTPTGIDVEMSSPGVDQLGSAGYAGQYDAHWAARISGALMISLLADAFKYAAAENGRDTTTVGAGGFVVQNPYESVTARTMERIAGEAIQESMRRPPTVTINQGVVVNVYVAKDVDFSSVIPRR